MFIKFNFLGIFNLHYCLKDSLMCFEFFFILKIPISVGSGNGGESFCNFKKCAWG